MYFCKKNENFFVKNAIYTKKLASFNIFLQKNLVKWLTSAKKNGIIVWNGEKLTVSHTIATRNKNYIRKGSVLWKRKSWLKPPPDTFI